MRFNGCTSIYGWMGLKKLTISLKLTTQLNYLYRMNKNKGIFTYRKAEYFESILSYLNDIQKGHFLKKAKEPEERESDSLGPGGLQDARLPSPSATPGACSNSCPSSQWSHPNILSYVVPFSSAFNQDYERQIFWSIIIVKGLSKSSYHIYIFYFCCCRFQVLSCWRTSLWRV